MKSPATSSFSFGGLALLAILLYYFKRPREKANIKAKKPAWPPMKAGKRFHKTPFLKSLMLLMLFTFRHYEIPLNFNTQKAIQQNIYEQQEGNPT